MDKRKDADQYFYGHGKLLLSGEYFVLKGAKALALPTTVGQSLKVKYRTSYAPALHWKSYDCEGKVWFKAKLEFWHFDLIEGELNEKTLFLQQILRQVRKQNSHFLRDEGEVFVETQLEFPLEWGLGSSSTLIYNIAQWAYVSPFELLFKTMGGSGYDIACAQSLGPILYENEKGAPTWSLTHFDPPFKENLYFVYLGKKQNTHRSIYDFENYLRKNSEKKSLEPIIKNLSDLTLRFSNAKSLEEFERLIQLHEDLIASELEFETVQSSNFVDFWGKIKSLGAWGGDFILATSQKSPQETREYFISKGLDVIISYQELILSPNLSLK